MIAEKATFMSVCAGESQLGSGNPIGSGLVYKHKYGMGLARYNTNFNAADLDYSLGWIFIYLRFS